MTHQNIDGTELGFIPVASAVFHGNERRYLEECIDTTWVSSVGPFVGRFERAFAEICGTHYAVSCANGTVALHLALLALGIGPGDDVLVPAQTYVATANAVRYCNASPVFVDSDPISWNIDPVDVAKKITPRTKAIIAVHLFGRPADMDALVELARLRNIPVLGDAAQALGATYRGRPVGSLGSLATFSFYGNKIVTCGEGGMVATSDADLARRIRQLKGQGQDPDRLYWFPIVGYNYRMTNLQAAIGLAQLEQLPAFLSARDEIASWYRDELGDCGLVELPAVVAGERAVCWLFSLLLSGAAPPRERVIARLRSAGIDCRPFFPAIHLLPPYQREAGASLLHAERLAERGLSLPTWVGMTQAQVRRVARGLLESLR